MRGAHRSMPFLTGSLPNELPNPGALEKRSSSSAKVIHALLYAKVSRGHRAGGYNMRGTTETDLGTFEPERVTAYEVGGRAELADNRLWFSFALYRSLFDDIQLRQQVPIPGGALTLRLTQNGGEARIDGGELEVTALLGNLRLAGALGIADAKYTRLDPLVDGVTLDSNFLQTPDATFFMAADRPIMVGFGEINLHADCSCRDSTPFAYDPQSLARQDAYGLFNLMITAQFRRNLELTLWVRNLADQRYIVRAVDYRHAGDCHTGGSTDFRCIAEIPVRRRQPIGTGGGGTRTAAGIGRGYDAFPARSSPC